MKLSVASKFTLIESTFLDPIPICEDGEGPVWKFPYSSYKHDPEPKILLLGSFRSTAGNNLVGGINLNYLDKNQRDTLANVLPQIMASGNLYSRYHLGKRLLPDIFKNFYRTYNAENIRGVEKDILYPKYGFMKTARNFIRKKVSGLFKSPEQRAQDAAPKYPADLSGMDDMLDNVVVRLGQQQAQQPPAPINTPEMQRARKAYQQYKLDQDTTLANAERQEDEPYRQATQDLQQKTGVAPPAPQGPQIQVPQRPAPATPEVTPQQLGQSFEKEKQENQAELLDPKNDINLDETIRYFSPKEGRYIMEAIDLREISNNMLGKKLMSLRPQLVAAAQEVYDNWEADEFDSGGICDQISAAMSTILADHNIESTEGGHEGDDHSFIVAYDEHDSFVVDIEPYTYEQGGGYSWEKIQGVTFEPNDILIYETDRPDWI
jgi:hypothetical protein